MKRDGYYAFPGIMTAECRERCSAAVKHCQAIQDHMIAETDWASVDWGALGLSPLETAATDAERRAGGGSSGFPSKHDPAYHRGLHWRHRLPFATPRDVENHGFVPEHFPLAYSPFLLELATAHPQMLALQRMLHGGDLPLRFDHVSPDRLTHFSWPSSRLTAACACPAQSVMLNRTGGEDGRHNSAQSRGWHSHQYGPGPSLRLRLSAFPPLRRLTCKHAQATATPMT